MLPNKLGIAGIRDGERSDARLISASERPERERNAEAIKINSGAQIKNPRSIRRHRRKSKRSAGNPRCFRIK